MLTLAVTPPKKTTLLAATGLKFVPVMVTVVPIRPKTGEKDEMVGGDCAYAELYVHTEKRKMTQSGTNMMLFRFIASISQQSVL